MKQSEVNKNKDEEKAEKRGERRNRDKSLFDVYPARDEELTREGRTLAYL